MPPAKSRPQAVGDRWRADCLRWLREHGWDKADRADPMNKREYYAGRPDLGDISGVPKWTIECKNTASDKLGEAVAQLRAAQALTGTVYGVVFKKRRGKGVADGYAIISVAEWTSLNKYREAYLELKRRKKDGFS